MSTTIKKQQDRILGLLAEMELTPLTREAKLRQLTSQIDLISRKQRGIEFLYEQIDTFDKAGLFRNTVWQDPRSLVPYFVRGTLLASPPNNILEILSELKMLKIANGEYITDQISAEEAADFLEDMLVLTFDLAFRDATEAVRIQMSPTDRKRIRELFDFMLDRFTFPRLKDKLAEEVETIAAQRPIITYQLEELLELINAKVELNLEQEADQRLDLFLRTLFRPTKLAASFPAPADYVAHLRDAGEEAVANECRAIGEAMQDTGLVSPFQWALVQYLIEAEAEDHLPDLLQLNEHGRVEYERHQAFIRRLVSEHILETNRQSIYGLKRLLERNLLSRRPVWNAFNQLLRLRIHPNIAKNLRKSTHHHPDTAPRTLLVGGVVSILGQPLGIGQGNNPTCQSARGISMWSQQAPAKLLNMIMSVAAGNQLDLRYEGELMAARGDTPRGDEFYANLDPVSIVLVPHLDDIYGQMMQRAMAKHPQEDPHASVNPAFYGHWIQTGFAACYNPLTQAVDGFDKFVRTFYAAFHPEYNGKNHLVYSVPIGIFITSSKGDLLGFHAISLLRVAQNEKGEWRAYFFNPNNEGRQNWGQGITPTVARHGERPGESSLPFHQFVARTYAFHYHSRRTEERIERVSESEIKHVTELARNSWGKKYIWI